MAERKTGSMTRVLSWTAIVMKVVKSAKLLKPLVTVGTMLLSVFAYSFALGVPFAIGFVLMIFVHELGHVIALRRKNIPASLPVFIPFLGAAVFAPKFGSRDDEAYMAFAGPLMGTLGAIALMAVCFILPTPPVLLVMLVYTAFIVNLFNLIPLSPLDGGRVTQAIGPAFVYVGVAALLILTLLLRTPGMLLIWILVVSDLRIKPRLRFYGVIGLTVIMIAMMVFGIGTPQPLWLNIIDVGLAALFIGLLGFSLKTDERTFEPRDDRPQLPSAERWKWLVFYGLMVAALLALTIWWHGYLPAEALSRGM